MKLNRMIVLPIGALALVASLAACGSGDSTARADAATTTSSQAPAPQSTGGTTGQDGAADREALRTCLAEKGITLPSRDPDASRPTDMPTAAPTGRPQDGQGFGRGFADGTGPGLPDGVDQQAFQDAMQACGGGSFFGGGPNGPGGTAFEAYVSCLTDHGVTMSTAGPRTQLDSSDPKVAAAEKTCAPLRPSRQPSPAAS